MRARRGVACALAALGAAVPAAAQEADTVTLTLEAAHEVARQHNPTYLQAANDLELNPTESRTTWFDRVLPSASLTLFSTGYNGNLRRRARDNFGNPVERPEADWAYFSNTNQELSLSWNVQGASLMNALRRQENTNEGRVLAVDRTLAQLRGDVRRRFYEVLEQRALLDTERELAESRRIEHALAERRFTIARSTRVDVLNAELAIEQQEVNLGQQRAAYEQAKLGLRTLLGDESLPPVRLAEEPLPVFDPAVLDADALVERALAVNPELLRGHSEVEGARLGVRESRNAWWPNVSFGFAVGRTAQTNEAEALFDVTYDEGFESNFFVQLTLPFFNDYFQNTQAIRQAEVAYDNRREALREQRLAVSERVRAALLDLRSQWETLRLAERSAEIADEALELARQEYRLGTRAFEDLRQTIDNQADTQRQVIQARYGFVDALITLEEAVGSPVVVPPAADGQA